MDLTDEILQASVNARRFGSFEPFVTGDDHAVAGFYRQVLADMERTRNIEVLLEPDHHGSGYASYVSAFLYPRDGSSRVEMPEYFETTGVLLYLSRLAPIGVFGCSSRTENKANSGRSSGFIGVDNLNLVPNGSWSDLIDDMKRTLAAAHVELLPRDPLLAPAPQGLQIPTVFDGPHFVFDALFYWSD
jgi:hypothetical protein